MKLAILGTGITAQAVRAKSHELGWVEVPVTEAEVVVTSPGLAPATFPKTDTEIISEVELAFRLLKQDHPQLKIIGVTGTNGKTTVTAMLAHVLGIPFAGNIGVPLINFVGQKDLWAIVVELSSYQLESCAGFQPDVALLLNITPDHLDRHKTMAEYSNQKAKIWQHQTAEQHLIYYADDPLVVAAVASATALKTPYNAQSLEITRLDKLQLWGLHNKLNAVATWHCARLLGLSEEQILARLEEFAPVEHRIETILTHAGRTFYNDSKATNPDSTNVAVAAFEQPINLILGGKDKGLELRDFLLFLHARVKNITVFGEIAERVCRESQALNPTFPLYRVATLAEALAASYALSAAGEVILFSPACSSFDQFENYEQRGRIFKELVKQQYGKP